MNNRILGMIGMICASALLIEAFTPNASENPFIVGICSMIFMAGSLCSHIGLWRIAATGRHWWGRTVLAIQLLLVTLAFAFGLFEATGLIGDENIIFVVTDIAWPVSMVWMLVVGITAAIVGQLRGWQRFVPLLCGLAFPLTFLIGIVSGLDMQSDAMGLVFFGMLAVFWCSLGFVVQQNNQASVVPSSTIHGLPNTVQ